MPILTRAVGIQETLSKKFAHLRNYLMSRRLKQLARPPSHPLFANRVKKQARYLSGARNVVLYYFGTWRAERTRFITTRPRSFSPILSVFLPLLFPSFPSSFFLFPFFFSFKALKTDEFSTDSRQIGGEMESLAVKSGTVGS